MLQGSFSATVSAWVAQTKARQLAVRNEAAQRVIEVMQTPVAAGGNMPVDTGFLRASLVVSLGGAVAQTRDNPGVPVSYDGSQVNLTIVGADLSDVIYASYGARYASAQEYGARGRDGRRFVALAAQQWQRIVSEVAREAQSRAG